MQKFRNFFRINIPAKRLCPTRLFSSATADTPAAVQAERFKGTTWNKRTQQWQAIITVNGKRTLLGSFQDPKQAADAYMAAKAVVKDKQYQNNRKSNRSANAEIAPKQVLEQHPTYFGVFREAGLAQWEAVLKLEDAKEISGGEYETPEEAAKAYDALSRMYLGATAPTNFPIDTYEAWVPPEAVATTGQIETRVGQQLTVEEIEAALRTERGEDIKVVPLAGRSDLADFMGAFHTARLIPLIPVSCM